MIKDSLEPLIHVYHTADLLPSRSALYLLTLQFIDIIITTIISSSVLLAFDIITCKAYTCEINIHPPDNTSDLLFSSVAMSVAS